MSRLSWNSSKRAQQEADQAYNDYLLRRAKRRAEKLAKTKKGKRPRQSSRPRPSYEEYINSKAWKHKRAEALRYYGAFCSVCGSKHDLHVHHLSYKRLGREKMKDLEVLCDGCHANLHEGKVVGVLDPITKRYLALWF